MLIPEYWLHPFYDILMSEYIKDIRYREIQIDNITRYYPGYTDKQLRAACNALCSHHLLPGRVTLSALILELSCKDLHPYIKKEFEAILNRAAL